MKKHLLLSLYIAGLLAVTIPLPLLAQEGNPAVNSAKDGLLEVTNPASGTTVIETGEEGEIYLIISRAINIVLGFIGLIVLIIIIVAGIEWMTSGGNADKISSAKKRMIAGVIGLAIILGAAVISNFAFNAVAISLGIEGENLDL